MKKIKQFIYVEKNTLNISYITIIYVLSAVSSFVIDELVKSGFNMLKYIVSVFVITILLSIIISIIDYTKRKETVTGLCFQVVKKYRIRDQYERFLAIKKCIETYEKYNKHNVKRNIYVVEASLERDQAYSVVFPILITVITAIFVEKEILPITSPFTMFLITVVILSVVEIVCIIPRNAFIKKVLEYTKKEHKIE